jgi:hypothetical protein
VGQRPTALGHHRYQWLHVAAFVQPTSGEAVWYLCGGLSKPFFAELLAAFAREAGAGRERRVVLVLDNAGWHGPEGLAIPDGISLVFLPPYSPELQPAERLWSLGDEPVVNRHVASLDELSPASPSAAAGSMPTPSSRTPTSIGGPSPPSRTDHPELV